MQETSADKQSQFVEQAATDAQFVIPTAEPDVVEAANTSDPTADQAAAGRDIREGNNPAEAPKLAESLADYKARMIRERGNRTDLTSIDRKLDVPEIEGYHLHWFLEMNIPKALAAWYEFVDPREVPTHDRNIGGRHPHTSTEDLGGSRVSQIAGLDPDNGNRPVQLILMKVRLEMFHESQKKLVARNRSILLQMFSKKQPIRSPDENDADYGMRYVREAGFNMSNGRFKPGKG